MFMEKENPSSFLCFSFWATLSFTLMNALVYVNIDQDIHKGKTQSCSIWKTKKTTWVFFFHKHSKFWGISLSQKIEPKPLFSEEWVNNEINYFTPLTQYHGPVWPKDVWSADDIDLMEIYSLSQYWLIHDLALRSNSSQMLTFNF